MVLRAVIFLVAVASIQAQPITLNTLLREMADRDALARFPAPAYRQGQGSTYNRASTARDQADQGFTGWYADGDGGGYIRTETTNAGGATEYVIMEHQGPGAITRLWTPFFYQDFNNRVGPNIRIYLNGSNTPVMDENLIELVTRLEWSTAEYGAKPSSHNRFTLPAPLANFTARAGDCYLPIPFSAACKVTLSGPPFYDIIGYRAYPTGTQVEDFSLASLDSGGVQAQVARTVEQIAHPADFAGGQLIQGSQAIPTNGALTLTLPAGPAAVRHLEVQLDPRQLQTNPTALRSTVLTMTFDGEPTVWCPLGDFFCSADQLHQFQTWTRTVTTNDGRMVCRWVMPYQRSGSVALTNLGGAAVSATLNLRTGEWRWDERSLHFHANWRPDDVRPGSPPVDWNFIDIRGKGVLVGDAWTVLDIQAGTWWGEGDEKIYVDEEHGVGKFPGIYGTGTEDYYGWAGGVVPTRTDEFSNPYLANVRVGGEDGKTLGYNINTRIRALDAVPFSRRLVFDMESSFGTDIRNAWNLLGYSAVVFWYGAPGATHNRPAEPAAASRPIQTLAQLQQMSDAIRHHPATPNNSPVTRGSLGTLGTNATAQPSGPDGSHLKNVLEFEDVKDVALGMTGGRQDIGNALPPYQWSGGAQFLGRAAKVGDWVVFTLTGQSHPRRLVVQPAQSYDYGILNLYLNERLVAENWDGYAESSHPGQPIDLGVHAPTGGCFRLKVVVTGKNPKSQGFFVGLDAVSLEDTAQTEVSAEVDNFLRAGVFDECPKREWPQLVGLVKRPWGTAAVAILWNPGTSDQATTLDFTSAGLDPEREYAIWSYRDSRVLGYAKGSWTTPVLPAAGSLHLCVTAVDRSRGLPVLIGSSLHPYCGALEIRGFQPGRDDLEIHLNDAGAREGNLYVYSPFALSRRSEAGCSVESVDQVAEHVWRINVASRQPGQPQRVVLAVALPLLQRPSFWLVVGVVLASTIFTIGWSVQRQRSRLALLRLEQQNALERERGRIARDLHDDLGANLAEIAMLSELAQDGLPADHPARATLNEIFTRAEINVRRLGDIVWAINPGSDTLEQFTSHLCRFAQDYLEMARIRCRLDLPETLPPATIDSVQRHNLFSAAKEAIHNAVRHGAPTEVTLRFLLGSGCLAVRIEDDGRGLDLAAPAVESHGTANMRARMQQIGGRYECHSTPNHGTIVTLTLPILLPATVS